MGLSYEYNDLARWQTLGLCVFILLSRGALKKISLKLYVCMLTAMMAGKAAKDTNLLKTGYWPSFVLISREL